MTIAQELNNVAANPALDYTSISFKARLEIRRAVCQLGLGAGNYRNEPSTIASVISTAQLIHATSLDPQS